jgi:hypothetical protein
MKCVFWEVGTGILNIISTKSRMRGTIPPLPPYALMVWCSVKKKSTGIALPLPYLFIFVQSLLGRNDDVCFVLTYTSQIPQIPSFKV